MTHPSDWLGPDGRVQPIPGDDERQPDPPNAELPVGLRSVDVPPLKALGIRVPAGLGWIA